MSTTAPRDCRRAVQAMLDRVAHDARIGVACSGGVDSVALAHAAIEVAGADRVWVVTIDHGLHTSSSRIARAVVDWANSLGVRGVVRSVEVAERASLEAAARDARFAAFEGLVRELGLAALWLGHTARDQAETVLMRILRGTGPAGLAGIPRVRGPFVRPFLHLPRAATEAYVAAHSLPTWDDPMNADHAIQRVRIRDEILPRLRAENPALDQALLRLAATAREWLDVIDAAAARLGRLPIECSVLAAQPAAVRKRALAIALEHQGIGFDAAHLEQLDALVTAPCRGEVAIDVPGARLVRRYDQLGLDLAASSSGCDWLAPPGHVLRRWQPGDRMRPKRLKGRSRKLSDLFMDAKVPRHLRRLAHVLVRSSDGAIVWAEHIGVAFDEPDHLIPKKREPSGAASL